MPSTKLKIVSPSLTACLNPNRPILNALVSFIPTPSTLFVFVLNYVKSLRIIFNKNDGNELKLPKFIYFPVRIKVIIKRI